MDQMDGGERRLLDTDDYAGFHQPCFGEGQLASAPSGRLRLSEFILGDPGRFWHRGLDYGRAAAMGCPPSWGDGSQGRGAGGAEADAAAGAGPRFLPPPPFPQPRVLSGRLLGPAGAGQPRRSARGFWFSFFKGGGAGNRKEKQ